MVSSSLKVFKTLFIRVQIKEYKNYPSMDNKYSKVDSMIESTNRPE